MPLNQPVPNIESSAVLQLKLSKIFNRVVRQSHVDSDTEPLEKAEKSEQKLKELSISIWMVKIGLCDNLD